MKATHLFIMKQRLLLLSLLLSLSLFSQTETEKMLGSWYMYHGNHYISNNLLFQSGFQIRTYNVIENHNLTLGYVGIGFKTNSKLLFTVKYGYLEIDRSIEFNDEPNAIEHRIIEDVAHSFQLKKHKFSQRIRLEHRFIHFKDADIEQHRLRYRIRYQYPIFKRITFDLNNEFFFKNKGKSYV